MSVFARVCQVDLGLLHSTGSTERGKGWFFRISFERIGT